MYSMLMAEGATFIDSVDFSSVVDMANSVAGKAVVPVVTVLGITVAFKLIMEFGNKIG